MLRRLIAAPVAAAASVLLSTAVLAGGVAIANLDSSPPQPRAGEATTIGFTILQHGVSPWTQGDVSVLARNDATGESVTADARAEGKPGHYVATLTFPSAGTWSWEIRMPLLMNTKFPPLTVLPAAPAPAAPPAAQPADSTASIPTPAIGLLLALGALAAAGGYLFLRRRTAPAVS